MELPGVVPGPAGEAEDGVAADAAEATGGAHAVALGQVLRDGQGLVLGQLRAEQGRARPLGEVGAAGGAAQATDVAGFAGPAVGADVAPALVAVGGAVRVGAGEG